MEQVLCLIFITIAISFGACQGPPEFTCASAPKDQDKIKYEVYYDAGEDAANFVLGQLCPVIHKFSDKLSDDFKPGAYVKTDSSGKLVCQNSKNKQCIIPIVHACASKLVSDFKKFVCCSVNKDDKGSRQCALDGGANQQTLDQCIAGTNQKYVAAKILLDNSANLFKKAQNKVHYFPAHFFNDVYDACLAGQAHWHLVVTICKMLKNPKPDACI